MFEKRDSYDIDCVESKRRGYVVFKSRRFRHFSDKYAIVLIEICCLFNIFLVVSLLLKQQKLFSFQFLVSSTFLFILIVLLFITIKGIFLGHSIIKLKASSNNNLNRLFILRLFKKQEWEIVRDTKNFTVAVRPDSFGWGWGKKIIIIYDFGEVYLNCDSCVGLIGKVPIFPWTHSKIVNEFKNCFLNQA